MADATAKRQIFGHAAVFDRLSQNVGGFFEIIRPGAFADVLRAGLDCRALLNHDPSIVLGRTKSGTLHLREDQIGLAATIQLSEAGYAKDLAIAMGRGDLSQMSFAFTVAKDKWRREGRVIIREVLAVASLTDVSIVTFPAYTQTDAMVREATPSKHWASLANKRRLLDLAQL